MDLLHSLLFFSLLSPSIYSIKLTARDLPKFKHPCAYDNPKRATQCTPKRKLGTSEGFAFSKIGRYNNFFCKVYGMCIGLTTGTVFLAAQALWRAKGLLPPITRSFPYREIHDTVKHWHSSGAWKPYEKDRKDRNELKKIREEQVKMEEEEKEREQKAEEEEQKIVEEGRATEPEEGDEEYENE